MFDIITFGSASRDINIKSSVFKVLADSAAFQTGQGICMPLGSKIDIGDIAFNSGGGGTNTAATFAKQGFKVAYCGSVGDDLAGREIINELKQLAVNTSLVQSRKGKPTNHSIIISTGGDRTILVYRGASEMLCKNDIPWRKIKAKWIYLAPLSGELCGSFEDIVNYAHKNKIKVAINPSKKELSRPMEELKNLFGKADVLFLNQEEASFLTKIDFSDEAGIFRKIDEICPGIAVMTKGGDGVVASDGKYIYSAMPNPNRKVVDTTGAGDSFASGFISEYMRYNGDIEKAIQFGLANSEGCLSQIGAKNGLLDKNSKYERVKVLKQLCDETKLCIVKN